MKFPNKREPWQISFNHSPDIGFKNVIYFYKKYTAKPYYFLVIDNTLELANPLRFRKNLPHRTKKQIMTIDGKIRDEKLPHDINRETAKILAFSSGKIGKY